MQHQHKATKAQIQLKDSRGLGNYCVKHILYLYTSRWRDVFGKYIPRGNTVAWGGISQYAPQIIYDISCQYHEIHPKSEVNIDSENVVNFVFQTLRNIFGLQNNSHDMFNCISALGQNDIKSLYPLLSGKVQKMLLLLLQNLFPLPSLSSERSMLSETRTQNNLGFAEIQI